MKTKLFVIISLLCCVFYTAQDLKKETLESIKSIRDQVKSGETIGDTVIVNNELLQNLNTLIYITKSINDVKQLKEMKVYFSSAKEVLDNNVNYNYMNDGEKYEAFQNLNDDLEYKIAKSAAYMPGNLEAYNSLFKAIVAVNITALIDSKPISNKRYRLYYSNLIYPDIISNIKNNNNSDVRSSDNMDSPYKLQTPFTKRMIFWLVDTSNNQIYLPDCDAKEISVSPSNFTISFKQSNLKKQ